MVKKFLRRTWSRYSKLGKGRRKKQVWRRPTGRDNKMREKRKGYPIVVSVGYRGETSSRGKIEGKNPILVKNITELKNIGKDEIIIIGKIGKKKKIELVQKAKEMNFKILNLDSEKFLKKVKKPVKEGLKEVPSGKEIKPKEDKK